MFLDSKKLKKKFFPSVNDSTYNNIPQNYLPSSGIKPIAFESPFFEL